MSDGDAPVDEILFPEEALAFLREARYDPNACRGMESLSASFHWSDEWLSRVVRLCLDHSSRAYFYVIVYRTSLIEGKPIEEYRRVWEHLLQACPEWPGFRPERCSTDLRLALGRTRKRLCIDFERDLRESERDEGRPA